jgi:hypothetical protein
MDFTKECSWGVLLLIRQCAKQYEKKGTMMLERPAVFKIVRLACKGRWRADSPCPFYITEIITCMN